MTTTSSGMLNQLNQHTQPSATTNDFISELNHMHISSFKRHLAYQQKFKMVSKFVASIKDVLAISDIRNYGDLFLWYHTVRHIMTHAITNDDSPRIQFDKVLISRGYLWNAHYAQAIAGSSEVTFLWSNDSGTNTAKPNDRCILVVYCEELNRCVFTAAAAERETGEATLAVPDFRGHNVQSWLGFIAEDNKKAGNSVYTGELTIT
jgi:hypothetical protein